MIKTKTVIRFFFMSLISAALACSTLSGSVSSHKNSESPSSGKLPEKTYLGDYITYKGYFFAVLQVQDPAPLSANAISRPGSRDVALEVIGGNHNGDWSSPFSTLSSGLGDGSSNVFGEDYSNSGVGISVEFAGYYDRGESVRGWMVFSLPENVKPLVLNLSYENPAGGWLLFQYGLTPPPAGYKPLRADTSRKPPDRAAFGKAAQKNGYSLKALEVKDPVDSIPLMAYSKPLNSRAVGVKIEIRNTSDSMLLIRDIILSDKEGYIYGLTMSEAIQSQGQQTVDPGGVLNDWLYFILPADAALDVVRLVCNDISNPMDNIILRTGLS